MISFGLWVGLGALTFAMLPADASPMPVLDVRGDSFQLLASLIGAVAFMPVVMLVTLVSLGNATLIGALAGIIGPFALQLTEMWRRQSRPALL